MFMLLPLLACAGGSAKDAAHPDDTATDSGSQHSGGDTDAADTGADTGGSGSSGCGRDEGLPAGGVQRALDAGAEGGGERGYWLSLPAVYDPWHPHPVVLGFPGTDWVGEQIQPYLGLEDELDEAMIFVYPDPLWRKFEGWGTYGGWQLGPYAAPADGTEDLVFVGLLLDTLATELCVDPDQIYVTGHSWGGDMAAVTACFLGDRVRAAAPAAANEPYWFDDPRLSCAGAPAVWTWFGEADDHFTWQDHPGEFGELQDAFWASERGCTAAEPLEVEGGGECVVHRGCASDVRYCLYPPATRHQIPPVFAPETMAWFVAQGAEARGGSAK